MIALHISALVFMAYALVSLILPLKIKWLYKGLLALVVVAAGLKYVVYSQTGGILEPKLDSSYIVAFEAAYSALMLCVVLALLKDVALLFIWIARVLGWLNQVSIAHSKISTVIAIVGISAGVLGTLSQFKVPQVYDETIYIKDLPKDLQGYQIVQLTDLHIGPILKKEFLQGVVDRTNSLEADLVVITGDLVDGSVAKLKQEFTPLRDLKARHGVLAVTGNHEYYSGANSWVKTWEEMGVKFLDNESVLLQSGSSLLKVVGLPDPRGKAMGAPEPDFNQAMKNVITYQYGMSTSIESPHAKPMMEELPTEALETNAHGVIKQGKEKTAKSNTGKNSLVSFNIGHKNNDKALKSFRAGRGNAVLLLAHQPVVADYEGVSADLILAGHTHGGTMFFLKPLIAHFNAGYVSGLYKLDSRTHLYVSNGTGIWSGFSCRIFVPSQIMRFTLQAAP